MPTGTSRAESGQLHGQLPKATGVCAVHSRLPPALPWPAVFQPLSLVKEWLCQCRARGLRPGPWMAVSLGPTRRGLLRPRGGAPPACIRANRLPDTAGQWASSRSREEL